MITITITITAYLHQPIHVVGSLWPGQHPADGIASETGAQVEKLHDGYGSCTRPVHGQCPW